MKPRLTTFERSSALGPMKSSRLSEEASGSFVQVKNGG
jgi:hypothetical protein